MTPATPLDRFHEEMATLNGPMVVVTARHDALRAGCLVGFHTQVSIEPAHYLVCLSVKNHTYAAASLSSHLAVHFLRDDQTALAKRFGGSCSAEVDKFAGLDTREGVGGAVVLHDCAHWFVGEVLGNLALGDHVAFGLRPVDSGGARDGATLLGYQRVKDIEAGHPA
ncbi:MAG TPA: flavin reductase family protein [Acidimicrobiales bacterium]|nr:flavin reductase family protein [Acidimicrobiales bacterium]